MADDELDELYSVKPDGFTALRSKLATAAGKRGDASGARRISAARKPTTAAWVVNRVVLRHKEAKRRLIELGDRLRGAHAALDGGRIRRLSTEQHALIEELGRTAFETAELTNPPAALREDVSSTLQAAIADPDVAARLGRLTKAERWSGFGGFGEAAAEPAPKSRDDDRHLDELRAALAAAEQAKSDAEEALSRRREELATAEQRHDEARRKLREAEQASREAAASVKEAKARLRAHS
ncbi:hypothetical protein [Mycobacterium kyorinense]|uniref:Uncharacterized protein n=1 Tax=Mycobacterium kyorinense TaxID=487514 RepID=A0A1X1Y470_9MYCO|nr:hypothetical protein [Mycobacterium kyorinense]ORW05923.1 hypothetical protein AWC14_26335 [Mycobacterium kyorinense]